MTRLWQPKDYSVKDDYCELTVDVVSEYQLSDSFLPIKEYVKLIKKDLKKQFAELGKHVSLYIFKVGDDSASEAYVKGKVNDGKELGVNVSVFHINKDNLKELSLKQSIQTIVKNSKMNRDFLKGIIVQLPLPDWAGMTAERVKTLIPAEFDVDGFRDNAFVNPCTPQGIIDYLNYNHVTFKDMNAVIIGRSDIVGKPLAKMLTDLNANVTLLHSKTSYDNMYKYVKNADIIFTAVGKQNLLINEKFEFKKSAFVIDIGINRDEQGKLCGDCERNLPVLYQSPVPGGVGLLTRVALFSNLLNCVSINLLGINN